MTNVYIFVLPGDEKTNENRPKNEIRVRKEICTFRDIYFEPPLTLDKAVKSIDEKLSGLENLEPGINIQTVFREQNFLKPFFLSPSGLENFFET